ncbi:RING zinc finger protein, putative [Plasmodium knowlesi strain H]|uniref:RING zinc finger protein, putative n=3 Tax=Plasmodium knowlesi TaxID=5850 RepID=A0A5K1UW40_PLAKH|nr:RING zinc finger protein, putative [Plasmodium knowlesi strain H]OTN66554.1 putative RING zinc finger protein [Plasmodium knowlesi]CAA9986754.1 RING zinc finger protein, putative [Plasmodium knowlesi strain H]SBO23581.1 RING zinc finger protein, putative [Plasmodium knowlesi strain H]SBO25125.1 RING zinc finger protein, putative [Plasmodium knowlesi strain H]VVS76228.1 RING zinc finger protein, putative [Plasmodium knowlesi strain H]|eukprot:XP_002257938.1 hypothetical protein, conserved in Plasmodium species [Plasmodium knowlesi strain H]
MKFGKNIRREMQNHPGMHYLGYKGLKKLIKQIRENRMEGEYTKRKQLNDQFEQLLHSDLENIERTFRKLFSEINGMKNEIEKKFASRIFNSEELKVNKKICSFDNLLEMLKEGGVVSEEVLDFCIRLSLLSNKCKVIRTYVVYNYVGLVKILKKRRKRCGIDGQGLSPLDHLTSTSDWRSDWRSDWTSDGASDLTAKAMSTSTSSTMSNTVADAVGNIVGTYSWCLSDELPQLITSVNIISDEFMEQLCNSGVRSEKYTCPICLCLIHDPVTLNSCFHSFCWNCLATAIQNYSIDKCPSCRTKIVYDRDSFKIDGILSQFLKKHFVSESAVEWDRNTSKDIPSGQDETYEEGPERDAYITQCVFQNEEEIVHAKKKRLIERCRKNGIDTQMWTCDPANAVKRNALPGRSFAEQDIAEQDMAAEDMAAPILPNDREDKPDEAREHFFPWHSLPDEGETDPWANFDEYLTVLNSVDKNVMEDKGRESDCCSDECRESAFPQSDTTKLGLKGGTPDASYRLVSDVISYTFS